MSSAENKMYSGLLTSLSEKQPFKFDIWMRAHTNDRTDRACNQDTAESFIHFLSWKKEKKIWWREKTQCLMHLRTTLVCHLISKYWWHLRHSQLWIHYWSSTVNHCFVVVLSIHLPPVPFAVFMCYCWIRTTSWTELMFAWQIICQHHPISTINLQRVYGREYWDHIACLCFKMVYLLYPDSRLNAFKWVLPKCNER